MVIRTRRVPVRVVFFFSIIIIVLCEKAVAVEMAYHVAWRVQFVAQRTKKW